MQETQEPLFDAAQTAISILPLATGWMKSVDSNIRLMKQAAQSGFHECCGAATYLVDRGVPSRLAHEAVGKAVKLGVDADVNCKTSPWPIFSRSMPHLQMNVYKALTSSRFFSIHKTTSARRLHAHRRHRRRRGELHHRHGGVRHRVRRHRQDRNGHRLALSARAAANYVLASSTRRHGDDHAEDAHGDATASNKPYDGRRARRRAAR